VKFFADQLKAAEVRMKQNSTMTVKEKVVVALLTIIKSFGFSRQDHSLLSHTPSRKDIASLSDTTYETVIRVLGSLEKEKIIKLEGKAIRILDLFSLQKTGKV